MSDTASRTDESAGPQHTGDGTVVKPGDPRYVDLISGTNQRFIGSPERIRLITSTADAVHAVQEAVREGKRIAVRSGGHCVEDFVCNPDVEVVLDMTRMSHIGFDHARQAFAVESGALLFNVYEQLYRRWGVTIPGGICYSVAVGGHVCGGGYGMLSRTLGLTVDHLEAVEVVCVDAHGEAYSVVASRDPGDPNHDLWWAHTGGGGGNFGLVTRYWFRTPGRTGTDPSQLLVAPPAKVLFGQTAIPWDRLSEADFRRLLLNYGAWSEQNSAPGSPGAEVSSVLVLNHRAGGPVALVSQIDAERPGARDRLRGFLTALVEGTSVQGDPTVTEAVQELTWLQADRHLVTIIGNQPIPSVRGATKSAYLRTNYSTDQAATMYRHLNRPDVHSPGAIVMLMPFGGQINAVAPDATASAQRDSVIKMRIENWWVNPADDASNIGWTREIFQDLFAETGGVPVPDSATDGCYINYADADMTDPEFNRSGVPWPTLYYKDNYPRLRRVKGRWDPRNVFRHRMSVEPPVAESGSPSSKPVG
ncbi:FAD-binding oxidoreductase [Streptomyces chrestomyceticus]|uniref:FAD-binding oxidoreductase n=1 Tax=Streptomyces chrestomyceticus TaxID=68185 RepID=UPI0033CDA662